MAAWDAVGEYDSLEALNAATAPAQPSADEGGASFWQRTQAGFKSSPESERNYYAAKLGADNARLNPNTRGVEVRGADGAWRPVDPEGFDLGDIADMAGGVPEAIGGLIGGIGGGIAGAAGGLGVGAIPGAIAGAAGMSAAGNVVKQAIGAMIPGEEVETLGQRAAQVGIAGLTGAVGEGAGQLVTHGVVRPLVTAKLRGAMQRGAAEAAEAVAIEARINANLAPGSKPFKMTAGEATGDRALTMSEDFARNSLVGAERFWEHSQANLNALRGKALELIDSVRAGGPQMSDQAAGAGLQQIVADIDSGMKGALDDLADRVFPVKDLPIANRVRFDTPNVNETLGRLRNADVNSLGVAGATAEGIDKIVAELPQRLTLKDMDLYLRRWGRTGYGKGDKGFMESLGDTDRTRVAKQLFAALSADVEAAAASNQPGHTLAKRLRDAKDAYGAGLEEMRQWDDGLFKKVVGDYGPESAARIADNISRLKPDELKSVMTVAGMRPDVVNAVRANWVERAFAASQRKARGAGTQFNAREFSRALGTPQQIEAIFGRTHPEVLQDLVALQRAAARLSDAGFAESTLTGRAKVGTLLGKVVTPAQWPSLAKELLVADKLTRVLLDPKARENLHIIANAKAPTQRVTAAVVDLLGQEARADQQR